MVFVTGCAAPDATVSPQPFGVTMVEETTCVGQGGRIVMGPEGAFCAGL